MTENNAAQPADQEIEAIMEQAQVFASAWAFLGGPFDNGSGLEQAERERSNLRALLSKLRAEGVQAGDERALTANQRKEFIRRTSYISEADRDTRAGFVDEIARAALASAPVAGEAPTDAEIIDMAVEPLGIDYDRMPYGIVKFARALLAQYAAPQASEAVRMDEDAERWRWATAVDDNAETLHSIVMCHGGDQQKINERADFYRAGQADKDGGDCAKGAGDDADIPASVFWPKKPTPAMLDALRTGSRKDWPSDELCRVRYAALRSAALTPTPSVVKQSLTATQTGEKGESDA